MNKSTGAVQRTASNPYGIPRGGVVLATLQIVLTNEPNSMGSHLQEVEFGKGERNFILRLAPNVVDRHGDASTFNRLEHSDPLTIASHELGHFLAQVFQQPEHEIARWEQEMIGFTPDDVMVPREKEAWAIAEQIYPNLNKQVRDMALASYTRDYGSGR